MINRLSNLLLCALVASPLVFADPECASGKAARAPKGHRRMVAARQVTVTTTTDVTVTVTETATTLATTTPAAAVTTTPVAAVTTTPAAAVTTTPAAVTTTPAAATTTPAAAAATTPAAAANVTTPSGGATLALWANPSVEFADGVYDCSAFPSDQPGVVAVDWLGFGGWTGCQLTSGTAQTCEEGAYCSYACQPGMSKSQWPPSQPSNGESRGGLLCKGGKLYKTNPASNYLCEWGQPSGFVKSSLSGDVCLCRTDYPGTENMVVPTIVGPGANEPLSVVNEATYYQWQGKPTSSQYYVNNMGVPVSDACVWGTAGSNMGNWAPLNFGAGYSGGMTWLSLFPVPGSGALNYNVRIVACDASSSINGECSYENGQYSGGANGCTVAVTVGSGCFELF